MESAVTLLGQSVLVGLQAGWLGLAAWQNLRRPSLNLTILRDVLSMRHVREEHPDVYAEAGEDRIENPRLHRLMFAAVLLAEAIVAAGLLAGSVMLALAALGVAEPGIARSVAIMGIAGFTLIFGAFLIGGEWVHYWAGAEGTQATHLLVMIWSVASFAALT